MTSLPVHFNFPVPTRSIGSLFARLQPLIAQNVGAFGRRHDRMAKTTARLRLCDLESMPGHSSHTHDRPRRDQSEASRGPTPRSYRKSKAFYSSAAKARRPKVMATINAGCSDQSEHALA